MKCTPALMFAWATHSSATAPPPSPSSGNEFNDGVYRGAYEAEQIWEANGRSCTYIWSFDTQVEDYVNQYYPTDTDNWRTNSFNSGVEQGAEQVIDKYERECLGDSPDDCSDLGNAAAQGKFTFGVPDVCRRSIAFAFCPFNAASEASPASEPNYEKQCREVAYGICKGAIYNQVISNGCTMTTTELWQEQYKCEEQIDAMVDGDDNDDTYIPPVIEECSDGHDCESCLSNSRCTWFQDIGYCEKGCGMKGCGATVCASDLLVCEDCLGGPGTPASGQYSWSPYTNECVVDCMLAPADAPCYKSKSNYDPNGYDPSICKKNKDKAVNSVLA
eukprot:CCRYP_019116-RA/>CCRYP_019116-RA protein AED:0.08 eAED:0.08 QI:0/0.66/0.75/1/1/1/4/365/330